MVRVSCRGLAATALALLVFPAAADARTPPATVAYTRFSDHVAGRIAPAPGLRVSVKLKRGAEVVATAGPARVGADGRWAVRLSGERVVTDDNDLLLVHFGGAADPPADLVVGGPHGRERWPLFQMLGEIYDGGHIVRVECVYRDCLDARVIVRGGTRHRMGCSGDACSVTLEKPMTADDSGFIEAEWRGRGGRSRVRVPVTFALPRLETYCAADLVTHSVSCFPTRSSARYTWLRNGVAAATSQAEIGGGVAVTLDDVQPGDAITLADDAGRIVGRTHVLPLRFDVALDGTVAGDCEPGQWVNTTVPCSREGHFELAKGIPFAYDDRTGGYTTASVPAVVQAVPFPGTTIPAGDHQFVFALRSLGAFGSDPAPVVGALLRRDDGGQTIVVDPIDPATGALVTGLTPGAWTADYITRDRAGNSVRSQARFTVTG